MQLKPPSDYPKIPRLTKSKTAEKRFSKKRFVAALQVLAQRLEGTKTKGTLSIRIADLEDTACQLELSGKRVTIVPGYDEAAELHAVTDMATWLALTNEKLSPVEAFFGRQLSLSGDLGFMRRIYALAAKADPEHLLP